MLQNRGADDGPEAASAHVTHNVRAHRDRPLAVPVKHVGGDAGGRVGQQRGTPAAEEAADDQGGEILRETDGYQEAREDKVRQEEGRPDAKVLHEREERQGEEGAADGPRRHGPVRVREDGLVNAKVGIDLEVGRRDDGPVDDAAKRRQQGEAGCEPFPPRRPVERVLWIVWAGPVYHDDILVCNW